MIAQSSARASVAAEVSLPLMISTSGIFSTGEKKWTPTRFAGRLDARASPVIGSVEVLLANTALGAIAASVCRSTSAFTLRSSNTASITKSQSRRAA